jgi:periplasmic protein TonB
MTQFGAQPFVTRAELTRWGGCAALVLAAHAFAAFAIAARSDEAEFAVGAPVVMVELAPITAAPPAPARDLAPGPLLEIESQDRVAEAAPPERQAAPPKEETLQVPPAPDPEVAMLTPEPYPEEGPIGVEQPAAAAPVPTAPQNAPAPAVRAAAPALAPEAAPSTAAIARWERLLVAQLERHKRYPPKAGGKVGEARLAFSIDRDGRVLASRIVRSSGSDALDEEALALVRRAAPLPPPPAGLPDERLSFVVPIRYR